jgi:hypothetical protein
MQMALEALESDPISHTGLVNRKQAIAALRQALVDADDISEKRVDETAKREHDPVAFRNKETGEFCTGGFMRKEWSRWTPLYTAPPKRELTCVCGAVWEGEMMVHPPRKAAEWFDCTDAQLMDEVRRRGFVIRNAQIDPVKREWVGLTDEEIDYQAKKDDHAVYFALGALWAEAKLKEKNA